MKKNCTLLLLFLVVCKINAQHSEKTYFNDSIVATETWFDVNGIKTHYHLYHQNGKINEIFHYNTKGQFHGIGSKYNKLGEKITTWTFLNGELVMRYDNKIDFNVNNEERVKRSIENLKIINASLKTRPDNEKMLYAKASMHAYLYNNTLALKEFLDLEKAINSRRSTLETKQKAAVYDYLGSLYANLEMKNHAVQYKLKALNTSPEEIRLYYNLGVYLVNIKSYRLGISYLNQALNFNKKHIFSNWGLSMAYTDLEEYQKAMDCINISFANEKGLYTHGTGKAERDIRTIRGLLYHKLGESEKGIKDLQDALLMIPDNSFAMRNLGFVYYELKDYKKACEYLQKAKDLGYEKMHDRYDLQAYLEASCKATTVSKAPVSLTTLPFVFPNPAQDIIQIENYSYSNFEYEIFDFNSKLVHKGISDGKNINLSKLKTGLYILKITNTDSPQEFKVIKI